nr:mobilome CxxCx(11)CxxC protein [Allomuricauda sp.]
MQSKIDQTKLNATSAKILHRKGKDKYERLNILFLIFTLIVPLFFIIAQYVTKGTKYENIMNNTSFGLSLVLIGISFLSLILRITDKITVHKIGMKNNIFIANECDNISNLSEKEQEWFFRYVNEIDNNDIDTFAGLSEDKRKETYREALKEVEPGNYNILCPICNSSPWKFEKGDCQLCGNKTNIN